MRMGNRHREREVALSDHAAPNGTLEGSLRATWKARKLLKGAESTALREGTSGQTYQASLRKRNSTCGHNPWSQGKRRAVILRGPSWNCTVHTPHFLHCLRLKTPQLLAPVHILEGKPPPYSTRTGHSCQREGFSHF